jgi:hypothetical protein
MIKNYIILVLASVSFGMMAFAKHADATESSQVAELGKPAPDFTLTDIYGNDVTLSSFEGQKVVLEWTNHKCPFVIKHYEPGNMQNIQRRVIEEENGAWLTIISSAEGKQGYVTADEAKEVLAGYGYEPTAKLFDTSGDVGRAYGAQTTPHMYIIDEEGTLVYRGAIDDNSSHRSETIEGALNYVVAALDDMNAGNAITHADTRPYGCSVKY